MIKRGRERERVPERRAACLLATTSDIGSFADPPLDCSDPERFGSLGASSLVLLVAFVLLEAVLTLALPTPFLVAR